MLHENKDLVWVIYFIKISLFSISHPERICYRKIIFQYMINNTDGSGAEIH